jgi:hypothetical protein
MTAAPEKLLAMRVGESTVGENLQQAIQSGKLIESEDGTLHLAASRVPGTSWVSVKNGPGLSCSFLIGFMFRHVYREAAVPDGGSSCFKVKVVPRTLRELVAAWEIGKRIRCLSKWGVDLNNPYSQNVYAGYFYTSGLDAARAVFKVVRDAVNADAKLGPDIGMTIKRGCSDYEVLLGPSDRYEFTPEMAELEAYLKERFESRNVSEPGHHVLAHWIDVAYRMGDETYLDFTAGRRRRPKTLTYEP